VGATFARNVPFDETGLGETERAESLAFFRGNYLGTLETAATASELSRIVETDMRESPSDRTDEARAAVLVTATLCSAGLAAERQAVRPPKQMPTITVETSVKSSQERCFDAARDLDLHVSSMAHTAERAVAGRTSGLIELGEQVTWEARHFGVRQQFTTRITAFDRPRYFQDSMTKGAFHSFVHDHVFVETNEGTLMRDVLTFSSPLGPLGAIVDKLVMAAYLRRLLIARCALIKQVLEAAANSP
jgi:ligand-binding SRPBCC domain-containing protein